MDIFLTSEFIEHFGAEKDLRDLTPSLSSVIDSPSSEYNRPELKSQFQHFVMFVTLGNVLNLSQAWDSLLQNGGTAIKGTKF